MCEEDSFFVTTHKATTTRGKEKTKLEPHHEISQKSSFEKILLTK